MLLFYELLYSTPVKKSSKKLDFDALFKELCGSRGCSWKLLKHLQNELRYYPSLSGLKGGIKRNGVTHHVTTAKELSEKLGVADRNIKVALNKLKDLGFIDWEVHQFGRKGKKGLVPMRYIRVYQSKLFLETANYFGVGYADINDIYQRGVVKTQGMLKKEANILESGSWYQKDLCYLEKAIQKIKKYEECLDKNHETYKSDKHWAGGVNYTPPNGMENVLFQIAQKSEPSLTKMPEPSLTESPETSLTNIISKDKVWVISKDKVIIAEAKRSPPSAGDLLKQGNLSPVPQEENWEISFSAVEKDPLPPPPPLPPIQKPEAVKECMVKKFSSVGNSSKLSKVLPVDLSTTAHYAVPEVQKKKPSLTGLNLSKHWFQLVKEHYPDAPKDKLIRENKHVAMMKKLIPVCEEDLFSVIEGVIASWGFAKGKLVHQGIYLFEFPTMELFLKHYNELLAVSELYCLKIHKAGNQTSYPTQPKKLISAELVKSLIEEHAESFGLSKQLLLSLEPEQAFDLLSNQAATHDVVLELPALKCEAVLKNASNPYHNTP